MQASRRKAEEKLEQSDLEETRPVGEFCCPWAKVDEELQPKSLSNTGGGGGAPA